MIRRGSKCEVEKIRKKLLKSGLEKIAETQNISKIELNQVKKFKKKLINELKEIARLRRIKNI